MTDRLITTKAELTPLEPYRVLSSDSDQPVGTVYLTAVGRRAAYGVDCVTGDQVVLRPIQDYIEQHRLKPVEQVDECDRSPC